MPNPDRIPHLSQKSRTALLFSHPCHPPPTLLSFFTVYQDPAECKSRYPEPFLISPDPADHARFHDPHTRPQLNDVLWIITQYLTSSLNHPKKAFNTYTEQFRA
jgi:hypothetical protein